MRKVTRTIRPSRSVGGRRVEPTSRALSEETTDVCIVGAACRLSTLRALGELAGIVIDDARVGRDGQTRLIRRASDDRSVVLESLHGRMGPPPAGR